MIISDRKNWTVHGLWPSKEYVQGPSYCNHSAHFDPKAINPIVKDLQLHWTNIRANTKVDNFWKHEWEKHGTCAMQLPALNSELKYFQAGLYLNINFPISQYLHEAKIDPGSNYFTRDIFHAIKRKTGKNPEIGCQMVQGIIKPVLSQISICLNKNLQLMDCDQAAGGLFHTCHQFELVFYPATEKIREHSNAGIAAAILTGLVLFAIAAYFIKSKCERFRNQNHEYQHLIQPQV